MVLETIMPYFMVEGVNPYKLIHRPAYITSISDTDCSRRLLCLISAPFTHVYQSKLVMFSRFFCLTVAKALSFRPRVLCEFSPISSGYGVYVQYIYRLGLLK